MKVNVIYIDVNTTGYGKSLLFCSERNEQKEENNQKKENFPG
jgi:hypothetical protein